MGQSQLVILLLSLLAAGLGAIAVMATLYARQSADDRQVAGSGLQEGDAVDLAHRRREFMRRYPAWAARDFQHDRNSPWFSDPDFTGSARR